MAMMQTFVGEIKTDKYDILKRRLCAVLHLLQGRGNSSRRKHSCLLFKQQRSLQSLRQMVQGHPSQNRQCPCGWCSGGETGQDRRWFDGNDYRYGRENQSGHMYDQQSPYTESWHVLRRPQTSDCKSGGAMLNVSGHNRFYYLRNFHDMRCKYERVRSIIRQQFNREPEAGDIFIMMSKNRRLVRLFNYDRRSYSLHEKRFQPGYQFLRVEREGEENVYKIDWKDVVTLLESPVVKTLKIK